MKEYNQEALDLFFERIRDLNIKKIELDKYMYALLECIANNGFDKIKTSKGLYEVHVEVLETKE